MHDWIRVRFQDEVFQLLLEFFGGKVFFRFLNTKVHVYLHILSYQLIPALLLRDAVDDELAVGDVFQLFTFVFKCEYFVLLYHKHVYDKFYERTVAAALKDD